MMIALAGTMIERNMIRRRRKLSPRTVPNTIGVYCRSVASMSSDAAVFPVTNTSASMLANAAGTCSPRRRFSESWVPSECGSPSTGADTTASVPDGSRSTIGSPNVASRSSRARRSEMAPRTGAAFSDCASMTTRAGAIIPAENSSSRTSNAARESVPVGRLLTPEYPCLIVRVGTAAASSNATTTPALSAGRRMTNAVTRSHRPAPALLERRLPKGSRKLSMRSPRTERSAGRIVSAAITEIVATATAPIARLRYTVDGTISRLARPITTVPPENSTARLAVAPAWPIASYTLLPRARSSR